MKSGVEPIQPKQGHKNRTKAGHVHDVFPYAPANRICVSHGPSGGLGCLAVVLIVLLLFGAI